MSLLKVNQLQNLAATSTINVDEIVTTKTSTRNTVISASPSGILAESSTPAPSHKDVIYTGNGTSQDIVTGLPSRDANWVSGTTYQLGDYAIDSDSYDIFQANVLTSGTTAPAISSDWDSVADGVHVDFDNVDVWIKGRSGATNNKRISTLIGVGISLVTNTTASQLAEATGLTSFNIDGFSIGADSEFNTNLATYVTWCEYFDKMVSGVTSEGKRYIEAYNAKSGKGMRIRVGSGAVDTIPHSIGTEIDFNVTKNRTSTGNWHTYDTPSGATKYKLLSTNVGNVTGSTVWNDTEPTDTTMTVGTGSGVNTLNLNYIDYYSSNRKNHSYVGQYTGTGAAGNEVDVGMDLLTLDTAGKNIKVMWKRLSGTGNWHIVDSVRGVGTGSTAKFLLADLANTEATASTVDMVFTTTGVSLGNTSSNINASGSQYLIEVTVEDYDNPNGGVDVPADSILAYAEGTDATTGDLDSIEVTTFHDDVSLTSNARNYIYMDKGNVVGSTIYPLIKEANFTVTDANSDSYDVSEGILRLATTGTISSRVYLGEVVVDGSGDIIPETLIEYQVKHLDVAELEVYGEIISPQVCTAWVNFDGTTTPPTINGSYNVDDVVRTTTGTYEVYFTVPMDNINYSAPCAGGAYDAVSSTKQLSNVQIHTGLTASTKYNEANVSVSIFGGKN